MCGCKVFITAGTEGGHSRAHTNGYKMDIRSNPQLDAWVAGHMRQAGKLNGFDVFVNDKEPTGGGAGWMYEDPGTDNAHHDVDIRGAQNGAD